MKPPTTLGADAAEWLEHHGIIARKPPLRGSDYGRSLRNPRGHYLHRRLGLIDCLQWSQALTHGSWFHTYFEHDGRIEPVHNAWRVREAELRAACATRGILPDKAEEIVERELRSRFEAFAWHTAATNLVVPGLGPGRGRSYNEWIAADHWHLLGSEVTLAVTRPPRITEVVQLDKLYLHKEQNTLYIIDPKTTTGSCVSRLQTIAHEFPTQLYMSVVAHALDTGLLQELYPILDDKTRLAQMVHLAVRKPSIKFGANDRDFKEHEHILQRGPRKGQAEIRRTYSGEPRHENYIRRCLRWYRAEEEFLGHTEEWQSDPPVNVSFTPYTMFRDNPTYAETCTQRCDYLHHMNTCPPWPGNFHFDPAVLRNRDGTLTSFAPLYLLPPARWPDVIQELGFIQKWRDQPWLT